MPNFSGVWNLKEQIQAIAAGRWTGLPTFELYAWGDNSAGQLGDGTTTNRTSSPVPISNIPDWTALSAGIGFSLAINNGELYSWGSGSNGKLGHGNVTDYSSPVQVGSLNTWASVSRGGQQHSLAVKTDGTFWSWGRNSSGELGLGNVVYRSSPVQVGALTNWSQPQGGLACSAAIKTDGTLWTWGSGDTGTLGHNNTIYRSSPVQVGGLSTWAKVTSSIDGAGFMLAIKTDGTLWSWGGNARGQLGLNDLPNRSSPVQVGVLSTWADVSADTSSTFATTSGGALYAWGDNGNSQLGLGSGLATYISSPVQIGALTNWSKVEAGVGWCLSIKTDGTLWGWGNNDSGQLLDGTTTLRNSPIQIGSATNWVQVSAGSNFAISTIQGSSN